MKDPLLKPTSTSSSNLRITIAISLTLLAFIIELSSNNPNSRTLIQPLVTLLRQHSTTLLTIFLLTVILKIYRHTSHLQSIVNQSSIPPLPATPNANYLTGHYGQLIRPSTHSTLFRDHASPSGITSLWGPHLKPCASVLRADHARLILRHTPNRDFSNFIVKHGRRTLGQNSLILIGGGKEWKGTRKVVSGAFTVGAVSGGRDAVGECAVQMVQWLKARVTPDVEGCSTEYQLKRVVRHNKSKEVKCVYLEVEEFFKLFSLDVFGKVTLDYDFECLKKATITNSTTSSSASTTEESQSHNNNNTHDSHDQIIYTRFTSPPEAAAFEYLERDIGIRAHPKNLLNPLTQWYWMPTRHNWEYHKNLKMVNDLMEGVIGPKLDEYLLREIERGGCVGSSGRRREEEEEENVITMMLKSVIEQYFHSSNGKQSRSSSTSHTASSGSSCPFASSSSNNNKNSNTTTIPTKLTQSERKQIITNVSHILHTLLVAGYETTAVSLSYTMHCLSQHPRVQDRACEEARRVLGRSEDYAGVQFNEEELPYNKAVIMEALRLHVPVVFTTRSSSKDITLDMDDEGNMVTVPKGTRFFVNATMVHLDERNFERAEEFIPERWVRWEDGRWVDRDFELEKSGGGSSSLETSSTSPPPSLDDKYATENAQADRIPAANPQSFFAFSDGARNCIGRRLAIMESTIFVAVLLRDMCVDWAEEGFEMEKERRFVILAPKKLPIALWRRDD